VDDSQGERIPLSPISSFPSEALQREAPGCALGAFGVVRVPFEEIAALRKAPGPWEGPKLPLSLMKHADHQTILAISAVIHAIDDFGWHGRSFADWGVVAAPRFLGRVFLAAALDRFARLGVPGMSPLIIPTLSLHAVAGSVSMAIKSLGFNFGVGGGPGHLVEALLLALASREDHGVPGIWVVATAFDPEPVPDTAGHSTVPAVGHGVALALTPTTLGESKRLLRIVDTIEGDAPVSPSSLVSLAEFLTRSPETPGARRWACPVPGGGAVELVDGP
jgi:hypothetical protein